MELSPRTASIPAVLVTWFKSERRWGETLADAHGGITLFLHLITKYLFF